MGRTTGAEPMRSPIERPQPDRILATLKDFQRDTVEYAFRRLYTDPDSTHRLLVADEVGLGKTLVARGVIARTVDALWDVTRRIDVVYICSNSDIARQNVNRLNVMQSQEFALASRITLLPTQLHGLRNRKLNFISFTPGTSFDLRSSMGVVRERALIYWMLEDAWGLRGRRPQHVLRGGAAPETFQEQVRALREERIDRLLLDEFKKALERQIRHDKEGGEKDIKTRLDELCDVYSTSRSAPGHELVHQRRLAIARLRSLLATTCIQALEPDLIILDEFQRFKHLLDGEDAASLLARDLFDYSSESMRARVLLLSATPYKMYTVVDEASDEDHYVDFLRTMRFLLNDPEKADKCKALLSAYRTDALRLATQGPEALESIGGALQALLRKVIVRTERLSATPDRDGMLRAVSCKGVSLAARDLRAYRAYQDVARELDHHDTVEYWKSAPYLLNFMEQYKLKEQLRTAQAEPDLSFAIANAVRGADGAILDWQAIEAYQQLDANNGRLRWLLAETLDQGLWRYLWLPPSLPSYVPRGAYQGTENSVPTKRLIFSSWQVVPRALAALLSYEAERRMFALHEATPSNTPEARERRRALLRFTLADGRLTGMGVFTLLYPSFALARLGSPAGWASGTGERPPLEEVERSLAVEIRAALEPFIRKAPDSGPEDESWYWAAGVQLDLAEDPQSARKWLLHRQLAAGWAGESDTDESADREDRSGWEQHILELQRLVSGELKLGRPPADLVGVLVQIALGSPSVCALRALATIAGGPSAIRDAAIRLQAGRVGLAFRTLYNVPEVMALIRGLKDAEPYWQRVLEYGVDGGLSAVLDEYAHVLHESLGLVGHTSQKVATEVAEAMAEAVSLRTAQIGADEIEVSKTRGYKLRPRRLRARFAARFGDQEYEEGQSRSRGDQVRMAFNSPFWPFVLASTSVGQEGLDFHQYCHAVVHWNLPSNPVDLEQREGRVHRYKGHAVRKNLAMRYHRTAWSSDGGDAWTAMFDAAAADRPPGMRELWPYWLLPTTGGATIERHVPMFPLSREVSRYEELRRSLAAYRMVFGQPRQEDLLRYLLAEVPPDRLESAASKLRIDLTPPAGIDAHRTRADFGPPIPDDAHQEDAEDGDEEDEGYLPQDAMLAKRRRQDLQRVRQDPDAAESAIARCIPDEGRRQLILDSIVEGIQEAASVNPQSWAITLYASGGWILRLNVGMLEAFGVHADSGVRVVVYGPRVSVEARALLRASELKIQRYVYSSQPMASRLEIAPVQQPSLIPALRVAHLELVRRAAAQVRRMSPFARFHSPGVVEYLRSRGYSIPG